MAKKKTRARPHASPRRLSNERSLTVFGAMEAVAAAADSLVSAARAAAEAPREELDAVAAAHRAWVEADAELVTAVDRWRAVKKREAEREEYRRERDEDRRGYL